MRRPRAGLVTPLPGGPGSPSVPTKRDCLEWLDAARTKGGESCLDRGGRSPPVRARKLRPRGQKSRDGAPDGAHPQPEGARAARRGDPKDAPFGAPSPRFWRGARGRPRKAGEDYGVPGAAKNTGDDACLGVNRVNPARACVGYAKYLSIIFL